MHLSDTFTFSGRQHNHQYFHSSAQREAASIFRGKRHKAHNDFGKNERPQYVPHMEKNEKLGLFLRSSIAMTQICTARFHIVVLVTILDMDGGIFKTRGFSLLTSLAPHSITPLLSFSAVFPYFSYPIFSLPLSLHSFLFSISSSSPSQRSSSGKDELCCVIKQHLPGWLS